MTIGYGCAKNFWDMDQELKNEYLLTSAVDAALVALGSH